MKTKPTIITKKEDHETDRPLEHFFAGQLNSPFQAVWCF